MRLDYVAHQALYYVRFRAGTPSAAQDAVRALVEGRLFQPAIVVPWQDGPALPDVLRGFSDTQLDAIAASDGTFDGLAAVILTCCPWVRAVDSQAAKPGVLEFTVESKGGGTASADLLNECQRIALAAVSGPCIGVTVRAGRVAPRPNDPDLPPRHEFLTNHSSLEGVLDPVLRKLFEDDEDFFHDARERGFGQSTTGVHAALPAVFIPTDAQVDLWKMVPLFSRICVPADALLREDLRLGIGARDVMRAIEAKRITPVIDRRIGAYDASELRRLVDAGHCVTPRRLTARVASDLLAGNPLWRLARENPRLVREVLVEAKRAFADCDDPRLAKVVAGWADFTLSGAIDLNTALLNRGAETAMIYGHGALASSIAGSLHSKDRPWLPVYLGYPITLARALRATCFAQTSPEREPLVAFIAALAAPMRMETIDDLRLVRKLDMLLSSIALARPAGVSFSDWMETCDLDSVRKLRSAIGEAFEQGSLPEDVEQAIERLGQEVARVEWARRRVAATTENFELLGIASDAAAVLLDVGFPLAGTALGMLAKHGAPRALEALERVPAVREARELLEARNAGAPPYAVRILRARNTVLKRLKARQRKR